MSYVLKVKRVKYIFLEVPPLVIGWIHAVYKKCPWTLEPTLPSRFGGLTQLYTALHNDMAIAKTESTLQTGRATAKTESTIQTGRACPLQCKPGKMFRRGLVKTVQMGWEDLHQCAGPTAHGPVWC